MFVKVAVGTLHLSSSLVSTSPSILTSYPLILAVGQYIIGPFAYEPQKGLYFMRVDNTNVVGN